MKSKEQKAILSSTIILIEAFIIISSCLKIIFQIYIWKFHYFFFLSFFLIFILILLSLPRLSSYADSCGVDQ